MQRDRDFANYQDDGAFYNKRPGIWVEPKGDWGAGAVQLVEIPTEDEIHDNIVAYWRPDARASQQGDSLRLRLSPLLAEQRAGLSRDHRQGGGDAAGTRRHSGPKSLAARQAQIRGGFHRRAAEPDAAALRHRRRWSPPPAARSTSAYVLKVVGTDRWRAAFDLQLDGNAPVDLRLFLRLGDKTLSETWLYQYFP